MGTRVAIIGHVVPTPTRIERPRTDEESRSLLREFNYTRVRTPDGALVDHLAFLRDSLGRPAHENFSVWDMNLCASLLLRSHLERHGAEVHVVKYLDSDNEAVEMARLRDFAPAIVLLSTTFVTNSKHFVYAGRLIRRHLPGAFIVAGGHHVYTALMYMSEAQARDYLLGSKLSALVNDVQGEAAAAALVAAWPDHLGQVANLVWRDPAGAVIFNPRVVEDNDINATAIAFKPSEGGSVVHLRTARSCSFKCAFCSYPTIAGGLALMELPHVMATLQSARDAEVGALFFVDDTFNVPRPRFEKLLDRMIDAGLHIPWYSFLRCQFIDAPLVEKMRRSGCRGVFLGIESGSDRILKNMDKGAQTKFYRQGITWLKDQGILTVGAFIIGFPGETNDTVAETRDFIETAGLDFYFMQPFYYLHHTPVHKVAPRFGLTGRGMSWSHATMNSDQAVAAVDEAYLSLTTSTTFLNPDYTLWEVAYLFNRGLDVADVRHYRNTIDRMTKDQMAAFGIRTRAVTARMRDVTTADLAAS